MIQCWARIAALVGLVLLCLLPHLASRLLFRRSTLPRLFLRWAAWLCGMRVKVEGRPLPGDVFFVANHVSWVDILVMGGATGCAFVSKDDVGRWPVIGWLAAQNNTILIRRTSRGEVGGQIDALREAMRRHQPVTLFPEGTTGDGVTLGPFKAALFAVLAPPPRPMLIQPVAIDYGALQRHMGWSGDEPAWSNVRRILSRRGTTPVTLHFLEPFDPGLTPDRKLLAAEARQRIFSRMQERGL